MDISHYYRVTVMTPDGVAETWVLTPSEVDRLRERAAKHQAALPKSVALSGWKQWILAWLGVVPTIEGG